MGHRLALGHRLPHRGADGAEGRPPADHQQAAVRPEDLGWRDVLTHPLHLRGAESAHVLVVRGVVGDVPGPVLLLEPADPVLQPGRPGDRPGPTERLLVPGVGLEALGLGAERDRDVGDRVDVGQHPRLGAGRDVAVAHDDHRHHVLDRDPHRLERRVEAIRGVRGRDDGHRALAVAAVHRLQEVGLLGLGGQAGGGPAALHVDDQKRELGDDRQPQGLALQRQARSGGPGDPDGSTVGGADGGTDRGDLVFGLERRHAVVLEGRQSVQDVRRGRDRVGPVEHRAAGLSGGHGQRDGDGGVAHDVAVVAGREIRFGHLVGSLEHLDGHRVVVAGHQRGQVGLGERALELALDPRTRGVGRPAVEPVHHPEGEEVLAAVGLLVAKAVLADRFVGHGRDRRANHPIGGDCPVLERIVGQPRLLQIHLLEAVDVGDDQAALAQVLQVRDQGSRVQGHEHVRDIAGREDLGCRELDLEA